MATIITSYNSIIQLLDNGNFTLEDNSYKVTLHSSAYVPNVSGHSGYADLSGELPTANGYTNGGVLLVNPRWIVAAGKAKFDADDTEIAVTSTNLVARFAVLRAIGTFGGVVDPLIAYVLFDNAPADKTVVPGHKFAISWNDLFNPIPSDLYEPIGAVAEAIEGLTKYSVGLGNVDNTSDANKPISSAVSTALSGKADTSHNHTGVYAPVLGADDNYVTDAEKTKLSNLSGTNSGDNATNSQYSSLATSKQDALVSGTNIKTINATSLLGSGDISISGGASSLDGLSDVVVTTPATKQVVIHNGTNFVNRVLESADMPASVVQKDIDGNIIGDILPMRDTFVDLLTFAGEAGLLATSSDTPQIVVYKGGAEAPDVFTSQEKTISLLQRSNENIFIGRSALGKVNLIIRSDNYKKQGFIARALSTAIDYFFYTKDGVLWRRGITLPAAGIYNYATDMFCIVASPTTASTTIYFGLFTGALTAYTMPSSLVWACCTLSSDLAEDGFIALPTAATDKLQYFHPDTRLVAEKTLPVSTTWQAPVRLAHGASAINNGSYAITFSKSGSTGYAVLVKLYSPVGAILYTSTLPTQLTSPLMMLVNDYVLIYKTSTSTKGTYYRAKLDSTTLVWEDITSLVPFDAVSSTGFNCFSADFAVFQVANETGYTLWVTKDFNTWSSVNVPTQSNNNSIIGNMLINSDWALNLHTLMLISISPLTLGFLQSSSSLKTSGNVILNLQSNYVDKVSLQGDANWQGARYETTGTAFTLHPSEVSFTFDPASVVASVTINLPAFGYHDQKIEMQFGGTIASGSTVVTTLTIAVEAGGASTILGTAATTAVSGTPLTYKYNIYSNRWYRMQ